MLDDLAIKYNHSPLDYMLAVLNNPMSSPEKKMMAPKASPYVHAKLATTTTKLGSDGPIKINIKWRRTIRILLSLYATSITKRST